MKKNYLLILSFVFLLLKTNAQSPQLFKDLYPGPYPAQSNPACFYNAGSNMYFVTFGTSYVHQLWKTDGTPGNTVMVKDSLITTTVTDPVNVIAFMGGMVYFTVSLGSGSSATTTQLWKTDGTTAGTSQVTVLTHAAGTGSGGGIPSNFTVVGSKIFFSMGATNGRELWVSDGSAAGTMEVVDLAPGTVSGQQIPGVEDLPMISFNGKVYFSGCTTAGNYELFTSDGTSAGTVLAMEINPSAFNGSNPNSWVVFNNQLYFLANDGSTSSSNGIWKTNGTSITKVFQNLLSNRQPTIFKNKLFFANGIDLYNTDGTTGGTAMVNDSSATTIVGANGNFLLSVYQQYISTPPYNLNHNWRSDGFTGNSLVSYDVENSASFDTIGNYMYTSRLDSGSFSSSGLWQTDGTQAGTTKLTNYGTPGFKIFNNTIFFQHYDPAYGTELWSFSPSSTSGIISPGVLLSNANIYPNPSKGIFSLDAGASKILSVKVFSILGSEMFSRDNMMDEKTVNLSELANGVYLLQAQTNDGPFTKKVVIQK